MTLTNIAIRTETVRANGLDFEVQQRGAGDRLALCLHGFPEHAHSWRHQLPLLAGLGFVAWAPNLRGYGRSSIPVGVESYAIEKLMDDVAALIDASGCSQVTLIGHDWGGFIAWHFASRRLRPLQRLVIVNSPHPGAMKKLMRGNLRQLRRSYYVLFFLFPRLPEALLGGFDGRIISRSILRMAADRSAFPPEAMRVYEQNATRAGGMRAMINYYRAYARGGERRQMALGFPRIDTPTLLVWGEADGALGKEMSGGLDDLVDDLTVCYLPGVSHWAQQERPRAVNAVLSAWLRGEPIPERGPEGQAIVCERRG